MWRLVSCALAPLLACGTVIEIRDAAIEAQDAAVETPDAAPEDAHPHTDAALEDATPYVGPALLSETGLYVNTASHALAAGVIAYEVQYPLWADGAEKLRYLSIPVGATIDGSDLDAWQFPVGTRAWKEFRANGRRIETRLLEKLDSGWRMIAFVWDETETDAMAAPAGAMNARGTEHDVPPAADCKKCHRGAADGLLGVAAIQLGPTGIADLVARGALAPLAALAYAPPGAGTTQEVLGYLHANCGHCHNDRHPAGRNESLRLFLTATATRVEDTPLYRTTIGTPTRHEFEGTTVAVVPGAPASSQLFVRMRSRVSDAQMPPLATERADDAALQAIQHWIEGLPH